MKPEVEKLLKKLAKTKDKNEKHRIRKELRSLGHEGGLRGMKIKSR